MHDELINIRHVSTATGRELSGGGTVRVSDLGTQIIFGRNKSKKMILQEYNNAVQQVSTKICFFITFIRAHNYHFIHYLKLNTHKKINRTKHVIFLKWIPILLPMLN